MKEENEDDIWEGEPRHCSVVVSRRHGRRLSPEKEEERRRMGGDEFDDDGDEYMCVCSGQMRGRKKSEDNLGIWRKITKIPLYSYLFTFFHFKSPI